MLLAYAIEATFYLEWLVDFQGEIRKIFIMTPPYLMLWIYSSTGKQKHNLLQNISLLQNFNPTNQHKPCHEKKLFGLSNEKTFQ